MSDPSMDSASSNQGPELTYFTFLKAGQWRVPRCRHCEKIVFYPRILCVACGKEEFEWIEPAGTGTVYSTTVMRRPAQAGGDSNLCLVDLDEGFRMMSRIESCRPEAPAVGDRVQARIREHGGLNVVTFTLMESQV